MWGWLTDSLAELYLFCFAFGLIFSLVSLLARAHLGRVHLPIGLGGDQGGHVGVAGHHGGQAHSLLAHSHDTHSHLGEPAAFNLSSVTVFLLWFGATGYILHTYYGTLAGISLAAAALVGWLGAALVYLLMSRVLWRGQTALDPENYQIAGAVGRITSAVHAGGTGEIVYILDGKRRVDGARSSDGTALASGTEVAIISYRDGLAYVCPLTLSDRDEPSA